MNLSFPRGGNPIQYKRLMPGRFLSTMRYDRPTMKPIVAFTSALFMAGCATLDAAPPTKLPEVRPGYVAGYLQPSQLPDSFVLLPPPPAPGSATYAADEDVYKAMRNLRDTPRWVL